jgi:hypothetical protein
MPIFALAVGCLLVLVGSLGRYFLLPGLRFWFGLMSYAMKRAPPCDAEPQEGNVRFQQDLERLRDRSSHYSGAAPTQEELEALRRSRLIAEREKDRGD